MRGATGPLVLGMVYSLILMSNINESLLKKALKLVQEFIANVAAELARTDSGPKGAWFDDRTKQLYFSIDNLNLHAEIVQKLHDAAKGKAAEVWSYDAVRKAFDSTVRTYLEDLTAQTDSREAIAAVAVETLGKELRRELIDWELIMPVLGMRASERFEIGNIAFIDSNERSLKPLIEKLNASLDETSNSAEEKESFKPIFEQDLRRVFTGTTIATVRVRAAEKGAAKDIARLDLVEMTDILNYFSIATYPRDLGVRIFLPSDPRGGRHEVLYFHEDGGSGLDHTNEGSLIPFDLSEIPPERSAAIGLDEMKNLLAAQVKSEIELSIITATRIAGKAHLALRREDAFLLFAIAIESLIVGGDEKTDLTYKLSTRCAHLLGHNLKERRRIRKEISDLYGVRSAIVHRGRSRIPEQDLRSIRHYALLVVREFLTNGAYHQFKTKHDLQVYFDDQMLS